MWSDFLISLLQENSDSRYSGNIIYFPLLNYKILPQDPLHQQQQRYTTFPPIKKKKPGFHQNKISKTSTVSFNLQLCKPRAHYLPKNRHIGHQAHAEIRKKIFLIGKKKARNHAEIRKWTNVNKDTRHEAIIMWNWEKNLVTPCHRLLEMLKMQSGVFSHHHRMNIQNKQSDPIF